MTHEYVIALGGTVLCAGTAGDRVPTAVAWAADHILAVGSDDAVSSISRGDSVFLDLAGCAVTPRPSDPAAAEDLLRAAIAAGRPFAVGELLAQAGLIDRDARLEPGSNCDLAMWNGDPETMPKGSAASLAIVAFVLAGAFTHGDAHYGPFQSATVRGRRRTP